MTKKAQTEVKEFKPRIVITGDGVASVSASDVLKTKVAKEQLAALRELKDLGLLKRK